MARVEFWGKFVPKQVRLPWVRPEMSASLLNI